MQKKIVKYLIERHNPVAIILHGSRAIGKARENSDWDFILLYEEDIYPEATREEILGQNIEIESIKIPVEDVLGVFGLKLQYAKVLFDSNGEGKEILGKAQEIYRKGFKWPDGWPESIKLWMRGRIEGMRDNKDNPVLFYRYFSRFYPRVINSWYQILHRQYPKPEYLAVEEIKEKDPEFYFLIEKLASPGTSLKEKVAVSEEMYQHLFK